MTDRYHSGAGIACIAIDLEEAEEMINKFRAANGNPPKEIPAPDFASYLDDAPAAQLFVFQDAGCC